MISSRRSAVEPVPNAARDIKKGIARCGPRICTCPTRDALAAEFASRQVAFSFAPSKTAEKGDDGLRGFELRTSTLRLVLRPAV